MNEFDKVVIQHFLAENWANFLRFCEERAMSEADADELFRKLEDL